MQIAEEADGATWETSGLRSFFPSLRIVAFCFNLPRLYLHARIDARSQVGRLRILRSSD